MSTAIDLEALLDLVPFTATLGMKFASAEPDEVVGLLDWAPGLCTAGGALNGGALMSLADNVGGLVAFLNLPPDSTTSTIESKTNFLRAVTEGQVRAVGRPLHVGSRTITVRTELFDDRDRLVAHVVQTQAVLPSPTRQNS